MKRKSDQVMTSTSCLYMNLLYSPLHTCWGFWRDRFLVWSEHKESPRLSLGREDLRRKRRITSRVRYILHRSPGHHKTHHLPPGNNTGAPTFDNTVELFHVVVCFAIVHHCSDGEDQFRLYLRESIEHTLTHKRVGNDKSIQTKMYNYNTIWRIVKWHKAFKSMQKLQIPVINAVVLMWICMRGAVSPQTQFKQKKERNINEHYSYLTK